MFLRQLALPSFDMRPICPVCGKSASFLGQYDPYYPARICLTCSLEMAVPVELWEPNPRKPDEFRIVRKGMYPEKNKRIECGNIIRAASRKRPQPERMAVRYRRWLKEARLASSQTELPYCPRCGCLVNAGEFSLSHECPICNAKSMVEAAWMTRSGPFAGIDDLEEQLDRLYRAFPEWFACGVMPDYWYDLARAKNPHRGNHADDRGSRE